MLVLSLFLSFSSPASSCHLVPLPSSNNSPLSNHLPLPSLCLPHSKRPSSSSSPVVPIRWLRQGWNRVRGHPLLGAVSLGSYPHQLTVPVPLTILSHHNGYQHDI